MNAPAVAPRPPWQTAALNLAERVIATYVEALLGLLAASSLDLFNLSTVQIAAVAAIPAALAVISNSLAALAIPAGLPFYVDTLARAGKTAVQTFLGYLLAVPVFGLERSLLTAAVASVIPAVLAVVKAALASRVGDRGTAALVPAQR